MGMLLNMLKYAIKQDVILNPIKCQKEYGGIWGQVLTYDMMCHKSGLDPIIF